MYLPNALPISSEHIRVKTSFNILLGSSGSERESEEGLNLGKFNIEIIDLRLLKLNAE
jgi:hypothetical protein